MVTKPNRRRTKRTKTNGEIFSLAGVHGVGKSTIYRFFVKNFEDFANVRMFPERLRAKPPVPFGSKNKQTAFRSELHYNQQMIKRNQLVQRFIQNHREHIAILDRSPLSTIVYSRALKLPTIDYNLILDTYNSVDWPNEHIFYLEANPKTILKRIYQRGSLDTKRQEWNEHDFDYLLTIINLYEKVFAEQKLFKKQRLHRIWTEDKNPLEIYQEIIKKIEKISGLTMQQKIKIPKNQASLNAWC